MQRASSKPQQPTAFIVHRTISRSIPSCRRRAQRLHYSSFRGSCIGHAALQCRKGRELVVRGTEKGLTIRSGPVEKLTAEELEVAIQERDKPLIIDFYATWCGPCLLLAEELKKVAEELGESIRIVKVDTDENPELSTQLQIQGLPTMVFVGTDRNKPALRTEGLLPAHVIKDIIKNELQQPAASEAAQ